MSTVLGLIGVAVFIVVVIAIAATVTWAVVKISPAPGSKGKETAEDG
jgi:hypothetical protein